MIRNEEKMMLVPKMERERENSRSFGLDYLAIGILKGENQSGDWVHWCSSETPCDVLVSRR